MTELILSDITVMGAGYCVIGLEKVRDGEFRSVRPLPPWGFAWREPFGFGRGDTVKAELRPARATPPHLEDHESGGLLDGGRRLSEADLVRSLRRAEVAEHLEELFGCRVQSSGQAGRALWVDPSDGHRSICGCDYTNLRFRVFPEPEGFNLRAELALRSNERIPSIPIVDRDWRRFVTRIMEQVRRTDPLAFVERFLNRVVTARMLAEWEVFARIGLPRPRRGQQCWLMLDSLFPQPAESWLELL
jgi:hypothetical protein